MEPIHKNTVLILVLIAALIVGLYSFRGRITEQFFKPQELPEDDSRIAEGVKNAEGVQQGKEAVKVVAENLDIPWEVRFLPSGDLLVTERPGTLLRIEENNEKIPVEGVKHAGEGGLLGMALHPQFEENRFIYLYMTSEAEGGLVNRIERYRLENNSLEDRNTVISGIPGAAYHDGGRIEFGPDGMLYITTGDSGNEELSQQKNSLAGKILRVWPNGSVPDSNPFDSPVYSYGHRNPQGLAWDREERLWSTEHGRSGIKSGLDELNVIEKGKNYGWPVIQGSENQEGMVPPVIHSGPEYTWAPASAEYWNGSIFFGGLRGSALYEAVLPENLDKKPKLKIHFLNEFGRIRAVRLGPDGKLYLTTSNTDGRGRPRPGDDRIIRIDPEIFR
ncbi:MAG: PQQ-dependent sugar dehydrogenase [Candidatus Nanohaloarchaea archaeon]|nr:PQQ-dependent sugar dehydrogenase [Candidatus Nanohaloarchaea archaeon]